MQLNVTIIVIVVAVSGEVVIIAIMIYCLVRSAAVTVAWERGISGKVEGLFVVLFVGCLTSQQQASDLRDGSAQTILHVATLR